MTKIEVLKLVNQNGEEMGAYVAYSDFCKMQSKYESMVDSLKNCKNCEHEYDYEDSDYCVGCKDKSKWEMKK